MRNNKIPMIVTGVLILSSIGILAFFLINGVSKPQNAVPSKAAQTTDPNACQGNIDPPAKCLKCKRTTAAEAIGVLDYSCFILNYGKTVGYY